MYVLRLVGVVLKPMHTDWDNTIVMGISGIKIDMPSDAKVSIFTDNNLTHINDDHFEINLVARLLNQYIYCSSSTTRL